ncbi:10308_t:CDS:2 [Ambispora gerdemannii]|uniref:10308_t:CDS:1 n=1 Tax=Ambispora gerdemannii TaxID=144530 RepID=A0A9N8YRK3_9GLOM|nr:10308_t:CDS:2 [Ambispora gerdemannii]
MASSSPNEAKNASSNGGQSQQGISPNSASLTISTQNLPLSQDNGQPQQQHPLSPLPQGQQSQPVTGDSVLHTTSGLKGRGIFGRFNKSNNSKTTGSPQEFMEEDSEDSEEYNISISNEGLSVDQYNVKLVHELIRFQDLIKADRQRISSLKKKNKELLKEQEEMAGRFEQERRSMQRLRDQKDLEMRDLEREVRRLKEESSQYQSALGSATNVRWGDDDANNSVQLKRSIEDLQQRLANFTTLKGKKYGIKINETEGANLLAYYKCRTAINSKNAKKTLSAALQRHDLEKDIIYYNAHICQLIEKFRNNRQGTDDLTRITPIKIRQQIYAILGIRVFIKNNEAISSTIKKCMNMMVTHREIKYDAKMHQQYREETMAMVIEVVHLYLRLNAQEPVPNFRHFFSSGEEIRASLMSGPEIADDSSGELEVEICSFPLISTQGNKVLCKAQVETRPVHPNTSFKWKK